MTESPKPAIQITNLQFGWHSTQPLLTIPEFSINRGEHLFLYGPSGSGKTTLLNLLAGVICPQQGSLKVLGTDLTGLSTHKRDRFRALHIGVIFQQFNLIPYLSVLDNVLLAGHFAHFKDRNTLQSRAIELLLSLGLQTELHHRKATSLSVGQQQRVAVARALVCQPELLIADEPTSALDSDNRDGFLDLLFNAADQCNSTVVFVSHDRALQERFTRIVDIRSLNGGQCNAA